MIAKTKRAKSERCIEAFEKIGEINIGDSHLITRVYREKDFIYIDVEFANAKDKVTVKGRCRTMIVVGKKNHKFIQYHTWSIRAILEDFMHGVHAKVRGGLMLSDEQGVKLGMLPDVIESFIKVYNSENIVF